MTDPNPLLTRVFEVLDLTTAGWEYGRVRVDTDAAALADRTDLDRRAGPRGHGRSAAAAARRSGS